MLSIKSKTQKSNGIYYEYVFVDSSKHQCKVTYSLYWAGPGG